MQSWSELPLRTKFYISLVVASAVPLFFHAIIDILQNKHDPLWLAFAAFALITVPIFVLQHGVRNLITIGDAIIISICMLFGTSTAVLANFFYIGLLTIILRRKHHTPAHRIIFNIASAVIAVSTYSYVYHALNASGSHSIGKLLIPTFGVAISYFLSNSILIATAIALSSRESFLGIWYRNYLSLFLDFLVSACAGAFIVLFDSLGWGAPLLIVPFAIAIWGINWINAAKAEAAENHLKEQKELYLRTVESLALAVDAKDQTTSGHIRRVRVYAMGLAKLCGIDDKNELMAIETGSLLHDIGKLAIDDFILNKPGRLSKQEFDKMKMHSAAGDEILKQVQFPFPVAQLVRAHHERWDGSGYPDGLKGDEIPLGARILAIADAFDAIRSSRPYKLSFSLPESLELLKAQVGKIYDPSLVEKFIEHIDELQTAGEQATSNIPELEFRKYFESVNQALSRSDESQTCPLPSSNTSTELLHLIEFCGSLGRQLELEDALGILSRRIRKLLPYDTCAFFVDRGNGILEISHASGLLCNALKQVRLGLGKGISGWSAAYKRAVLNTTPSLDFQGLAADFSQLKDAVVAPLISDGNCVGTISLYASNPQSFNQTHLDLLLTVANHVAPLVAEVRSRGHAAEDWDFIDPVTQTYRVAYLSILGSQMLDLASRNRSPLSMLCVNIKNYAHLANLYGPDTGNAILRNVADSIRNELRETDALARYGQQCFIAILPGVREEQASRFAQRLQQQVRAIPVNDILRHNVFLNCQFAVAGFPDHGTTISELLEAVQHTLSDQTAVSPALAETNILEFPPRGQ